MTGIYRAGARKARGEIAARAACMSDDPSALAENLLALETGESERPSLERVRRLALSAACGGSTRVLGWLLENRPEGVALALPSVPGWNAATVAWCLDAFGPPQEPGTVSGATRSARRLGTPAWASMKADAAAAGSESALRLLADVSVPQCTRAEEGGCDAEFGDAPDMCYACPACRIAAASTEGPIAAIIAGNIQDGRRSCSRTGELLR
jgi:hypothetical protein